MKGLARRRHDRWRMVRRAARIIATWASPGSQLPQRFADNMRICSCGICSWDKNPRRPTMRELRAEARWQRQAKVGAVTPEND